MGTIETYIRKAALARNINPDVAVAVARTEGGLTNPVQQSNIVQNGVREPSFGPFQLNISGGRLGARALAAGIDPRDPNQWQAGVDFALNEAAQKGWGQWYGWKGARFAGISGAHAAPVNLAASAQASAPGADVSLASTFDPAIEAELGHGYVVASGVTDSPSSPVGYRSSGDQQRAPLPDAPVDDSSAANTAVDFARATPEVPLQQTDPAVLSAPPAQAPPGGLAELFKVGDIGLASDKAIDPKTGLPLLARHRRSYG